VNVIHLIYIGVYPHKYLGHEDNVQTGGILEVSGSSISRGTSFITLPPFPPPSFSSFFRSIVGAPRVSNRRTDRCAQQLPTILKCTQLTDKWREANTYPKHSTFNTSIHFPHTVRACLSRKLKFSNMNTKAGVFDFMFENRGFME
jgi:hypothetical protein